MHKQFFFKDICPRGFVTIIGIWPFIYCKSLRVTLHQGSFGFPSFRVKTLFEANVSEAPYWGLKCLAIKMGVLNVSRSWNVSVLHHLSFKVKGSFLSTSVITHHSRLRINVIKWGIKFTLLSMKIMMQNKLWWTSHSFNLWYNILHLYGSSQVF